MHRLLTRETTTFTLLRGHGIGSRYDRMPDGSARITAVNFTSGAVVEVATETSHMTFDAILDEIERDEEVIAAR